MIKRETESIRLQSDRTNRYSQKKKKKQTVGHHSSHILESQKKQRPLKYK